MAVVPIAVRVASVLFAVITSALDPAVRPAQGPEVQAVGCVMRMANTRCMRLWFRLGA